MIEIRDATSDDLISFYGRPPPVTVRAIVALKDGVIECVAGVTMEALPIAFSDMRPDCAGKVTIFKTALKMVEFLKKDHPWVINHVDTGKFLVRLGFKCVRTDKNTKIYRL